jgi:hypothetical protein
MPYMIRKKGSKFQLVNSETGRVLGTHDTRAEAMAQMRAVGANK